MATPDSSSEKSAKTQYLRNKTFSYLFKNGASPAKSGTLSPASPSSPQSPDGVTIQISPALLSTTSATLSPNSPNTPNKNHKRKKTRSSFIQKSTTKTQDEQLAAIEKEVEFLTKEVPNFKDVFIECQAQWASSLRPKAEMKSFALIQALTQWIHDYGNAAVQDYDEFKQMAESEILSMAAKLEKNAHEISRLTLLMEDNEASKQELQNELNETQMMLSKYRKEATQRNEEFAANSSSRKTVDVLEKELRALKEDYKALRQKSERFEEYWKISQADNDDLINKNYGLEEENEKLKNQIRTANASVQEMQRTHQSTLKSLHLQHQNALKELQSEQEKLIQAQQQSLNESEHIQNAGAGYAIDADDMDIAESGVIEEDGADGIVSLENEINLYEYEDDDWLDEEEQSEFGDFGDEIDLNDDYDPLTPDAEVPSEEYNRQDEFEMEKTFHMEEDVRGAVLKQEQEKAAAAALSIDVPEKKNGLDLSMSFSKQSNTPNMVTTMTPDAGAEFEAECKSYEQSNASQSKQMQFASATSGTMGQSNELVNKNALPKPLKKVIYIDRGGPATQKEQPVAGKGFANKLAMFQTLEKTKGGKPQILAESRAYALINKWQNKNANNESMKNNPLNQISKTTKNVHVTRSTVNSGSTYSRDGAPQINVLKITKTKDHILKPRAFGNMTVVRSSCIPRWMSNEAKNYFFVFDALPSETNTDANESDFSKNRTHDFLVPTLFFFDSKKEYDMFAMKVQGISVRDILFQRMFAQYVRGTFPLNRYAMDTNVLNCTNRLMTLLKRDDVKLPISEINECGLVNQSTVLICNTAEIHRFACNDRQTRDKWVAKVNKLCDKRSNRLKKINNGFLGVPTAHDNPNHEKFLSSMDLGKFRPSIIGVL